MNKAVVITIEGQLAWKTFRSRSDENYIAVCDPLGITVEGESWTVLQETIAEAIDALFQDLYESGDLPNFLHEKGWSMVGPQPQPDRPFSFEMPYAVIKQSQAGSQRTVR